VGQDVRDREPEFVSHEQLRDHDRIVDQGRVVGVFATSVRVRAANGTDRDIGRSGRYQVVRQELVTTCDECGATEVADAIPDQWSDPWPKGWTFLNGGHVEQILGVKHPFGKGKDHDDPEWTWPLDKLVCSEACRRAAIDKVLTKSANKEVNE
jgi:hypothetical protein